jgi:hypothetical protein
MVVHEKYECVLGHHRAVKVNPSAFGELVIHIGLLEISCLCLFFDRVDICLVLRGFRSTEHMEELETGRSKDIRAITSLEHEGRGKDTEEILVGMMKDYILDQKRMFENPVDDHVVTFDKHIGIHGSIEDLEKKTVENIHYKLNLKSFS